MEIILRKIDTAAPLPVPNGKGLGYWADFQSELVQGRAVIILRQGDPTARLGKALEVWTGQEAILGFTVLPAGEHTFELQSLPTLGDYQATGVVASILWVDDDPDHAAVDVVVGPCQFSFLTSEIGKDIDLEYGQWVSFVVKRLTSWELEMLP